MSLFSFDFETFVGRRSEFAPPIVCGAWATPDQAPQLALRERVVEVIRAAVRDPSTTLVNQFIAYEMLVMMQYYDQHPERIHGAYGSVAVPVRELWDALRAGRVVGIDICQQLLDVARGEGLIEWREKQGYNLPNISRWNEIPAEDKDDHAWRMYYAQLDGIDPALWPEDARAYVLDDARRPLEILAAQMRENQRWIESYGHPVLHQAPENTWAQTCLQLTAAHGVRVDPERVARLAGIVETEINMLARQLRHHGTWIKDDRGEWIWSDGCGRPDQTGGDKDPSHCPGCLAPFSGDVLAPPEPLLRWKREKGAWRLSRNTKAAHERMRAACAARGLPVPMTEPSAKFPDGQVQVDEDACILSEDPVLIAYADYSGASHLSARVADLQTGLSGFPLHTNFTTVRATGRTSSRKPFEPHEGTQMQNWPRLEGAREALEPRSFWVSDSGGRRVS